jgi:hypothetical protein
MSRKHKRLPPRHKRLTREFLVSEETFYGFAFIAGYTAEVRRTVSLSRKRNRP